MYESEINNRWEDASTIPEAIRKEWVELSPGITARSIVSWGEHCVECAIPHCFKTCDLYEKRKDDYLCRRFTEGMVCINGVGTVNPWVFKIQFKKWAKLWADGSTAMVPLSRAKGLERLNSRFGAMICALPVKFKMPMLMPWRYRSVRRRWVVGRKKTILPDYFLLEVYNPAPTPVKLTFYARAKTEGTKPPFAAALTLAPGLQRACFPVSTIRKQVNLDEPFDLDIAPSDSEAKPLLYFGAMDFVRDAAYQSPEKPGGCKCVVWDLDNTVWDGVLIEDGGDKLKLKPGIKDIFSELDRRGILLSVASKNNPEDVIPVLKSFGLYEYLLKPQISWEPKGQAVKRIAQLLNIGIDSLIYIDDSPFERAEVQSVCPEVLVLDTKDANWLIWREECQVASTAESERRRQLYREQDLREEAREQAAGDYEAFLRSCDIRVRILDLSPGLLPRAHDLVQRTNQMNFSGTRYTREELERLVADPNYDMHVIEVHDRFGSYGIVGIAVMDLVQGALTDLAFSCRIQSKRIEHALLSYLLQRYAARPFRARWRKTERNAPAGKVFADLGFVQQGETDGVTLLEYRQQYVPQFDFIKVETGEGEKVSA